MDKRKLLVVTDEMEVGGTQRQIVNLLSNMDRSKFDLHLLYFVNDSYLIDELRKSGVTVTQIRKSKSIDFGFLYNFVTFLKTNRFDIVHSFSMSAEFWTMIALVFVRKTKFCSSIRGVYEWYSPGHWFAKSLISRKSAAIISNSESGKNYVLEKQWFSTVGIDVIHNGVSAHPLYKDYQTKEPGVLKCLVLGRLIQGKNIRLLLDAIRQINNSGITLKLEIAGSGPDKEGLQKYAAELNEGFVTFLGEVDNVSSLFMRNDILVQPSLREGLSNSILEAMFSGVPVVASDADGNTELISDSKTGYLFNNNDLNSLVQKLLYVDSNYEHAIKCASTVKKWVDTEFSISTMCKKFENKYLDVLNEC